MQKIILTTLVFSFIQICAGTAVAADVAPWGHAHEVKRDYRQQKAVFDVTKDSPEIINRILDRVSELSRINNADPFDSKFILVIHGNATPIFAIKNYTKYKTLMQRAQSLSVGGIIEFRMCKLAARRAGLEPKDIHGFVSMVPDGDAEIIMLEQQGFAYMH